MLERCIYLFPQGNPLDRIALIKQTQNNKQIMISSFNIMPLWGMMLSLTVVVVVVAILIDWFDKR
jgi:hypothetical protein